MTAEPATGRRRRYLLWGCLAAVVVAALIAGPISNWYVDHPHGNPDPGGRRLAGLAKVASAAMPAGAVSTRLVLKKSTWGKGGCDGGPPGWTPMEAIQRFRATGDVAAQVDANMQRLRWKLAPDFVRATTGQRPRPVAPGSDTPYVREYDAPGGDDAPVAWLFTPAENHSPYWVLDLEAMPAEVPDHAC